MPPRLGVTFTKHDLEVHRNPLTPTPLLTFFKHILNFLFIYQFIYFWLHWVFVAARGLFSSCSERGLLFVAVRGLLIAVASLVVEHGL